MKHFKVVIIGSGFGGQAAAINLRRKGIEDFIILERRSYMGGTWCQNTYPGAAVDVQSPLYSLSFEPYPWTQMFADQSELQDYTNYVIDKHKLRDKTEVNTNVMEVKWNASDSRWIVKTSNGLFSGQFLINASGPLSTPVIPDFRGRKTFNGEQFHTNDWNHEFSYRGKRVAVIGSGASAAQVIPAIVDEVKELHVFQRTPHWVMPRPDMKFSRFQRWLIKQRPIYYLVRWLIYWGLETRVIGFKYSRRMLRLVGQSKAEKFIERSIANEELRKKVTPDYTLGCKRVLLSNDLYPAYQKENCTLHTRDDAISEITQTGINTTKGERVDLDLIVYATGYDATDNAVTYPIIGKSGQSLNDRWSEFPRAYLGTSIPDYPNFFMVTGPNTGIGHTSAIFIIEAQMHYIMNSITSADKRSARSIEVTEQAETNYTNMIHTEMEQTVWKSGGCKSWYMSKSGHVIAMFPGFSFSYLAMAKRFKPSHHRFS